MSAPKTPRWVWYGLTTVLVVMIVLATVMVGSYRFWKSNQQVQQRAAAKAVEALGGKGQLAYSSLPLGFYLESGDAPNVFLLNSKGVTDDDLVIFESAPTTRGLHLFDNQITDEGLRHLSNLSELDFLDLRRNNITDAGLVHLEQHYKLKQLILIGTQVTPAGVSKLQKKLPHAKIAH